MKKDLLKLSVLMFVGLFFVSQKGALAQVEDASGEVEDASGEAVKGEDEPAAPLVTPEELFPEEVAKEQVKEGFFKAFVNKVILQKFVSPEETGQQMTLMDLLAAGGPLMYPIYICSILMLSLIIFIQLTLREKKIIPPGIAEGVNQRLLENNIGGAITLCRNDKNPISNILLAGLEKINGTMDEIKEVVQRQGDFFVNNTDKFIEYLSSLGTISPMLGLLGTVTGMISCFNVIAFQEGMGKPTLLAAGVSQALVTTAAGLLVGIPAYAFYFVYRSRARDLLLRVEKIIEEFIRQVDFVKSDRGHKPFEIITETASQATPSTEVEATAKSEPKSQSEKKAVHTGKQVVCPKCKAVLTKDTQFCVNCGSKIVADAPQGSSTRQGEETK